MEPLIDATTLTKADQTGIIDAPQLKNNLYGQGKLATSIDKRGACIAIDPETGNRLDEKTRVSKLINQISQNKSQRKIRE
jgi:hypothetical protein